MEHSANANFETRRSQGSTQPLVSVVIPTYNRAQLLKRALKSVLAQTHRNLEIIVVDDASEDDIARIVVDLGDSRIRYIRHETNKGGSAARNTGIREATGSYIAFLDDDDEWEPEKTEEQLKTLQRYDVILCTSHEPGSGLAKDSAKKTVNLDDLRQGRFTAGGTGVLMAKAYVLKETMFDEDLPRYQDWDLFIRIAQKYNIGYLNKRLVRYNEGVHYRISNKILHMRMTDLESQLRMVQKHQDFFGRKWFKRHMCVALLYGIKHRPDKFRHIFYTAKRYGLTNVTWGLAARIREKIIEKFRLTLGAGQTGSRERSM